MKNMDSRARRKIAIYGKGGIGKSTVSSNLTAALSDMGIKVLQIGCDPKHDSTRALIGGTVQNTVLDYLKEVRPEDRKLGDVVSEGYKGCLCVEAGGPEPGVGCAGRGIITAFDLLERLGSGEVDSDITLYDVLGDVVCGGFAVPLRNDYADTVYIVTSGEFMAIYAANNILRGTANYNPDRIGGIIFNSRGDPEEDSRVERFSEAVGIPIVARIPRSPIFMEAEQRGATVIEAFPDSEIAGTFRNLAHAVIEGKRYHARFLSENELEKLILGRETAKKEKPVHRELNVTGTEFRPYTSKNTAYDEPIHGCAFSGASSVCTSVLIYRAHGTPLYGTLLRRAPLVSFGRSFAGVRPIFTSKNCHTCASTRQAVFLRSCTAYLYPASISQSLTFWRFIRFFLCDML